VNHVDYQLPQAGGLGLQDSILILLMIRYPQTRL